MTDLTLSEEKLGEMLGAKLRSLRNERSMLISDAAKRIGISQGALSNYETGKKLPGYTYLRKLAAIYGVSYDYLLGDTDLRYHEQTDAAELLRLSSNTIQSILAAYHVWDEHAETEHDVNAAAHKMMNAFFEQGGCDFFLQLGRLYLLCEKCNTRNSLEDEFDIQILVDTVREKYGVQLIHDPNGDAIEQKLRRIDNDFSFFVKRISGCMFPKDGKGLVLELTDDSTGDEAQKSSLRGMSRLMLELFGEDAVRHAGRELTKK